MVSGGRGREGKCDIKTVHKKGFKNAIIGTFKTLDKPLSFVMDIRVFLRGEKGKCGV